MVLWLKGPDNRSEKSEEGGVEGVTETTTMAESSSERRKAEDNDGGGSDRISSLPDSVLCHILSFLPTKTCVATMSLVSRRWLHLWEHLQVLDFADDSKQFTDFAFFVNAVLALRRSRDIRKMRLSCGLSDDYTFHANSVAMWVRAAIGPCLEELSLTTSHSAGNGVVFLPSTLFNCTNLVSLSLRGLIHVNVQHSSAVRLPSLKMLQLNIDSVDSLDALLSGCPVLETLDISLASYSLTKVCVPPSLKRLKFTVENCTGSGTYLQIDAPGLKYLSITRMTLGAVGNLQNVVEAYLDVLSPGGSEFVDPLLNLLRALSGTKHLVLCGLTTKWLLSAPVLDFPEFRCLLHLELILPCFNPNLLVNVLQKCHMLQVLKIQSIKEPSPWVLQSISFQQEPSPLRTWGPQSTSVPNCLVSHLTYINIEGYQGFEDVLAFAEYILRNGLVLKTMCIIADISMDLTNKHCFLKRLADIPRGSVMCQLKFD